MRASNTILAIIVLGLLVFAFFYFKPNISSLLQPNTATPESNYTYTAPQNITPQETTISIASWNLQVFGVHKAEVPGLLQSYADKIKKYDIIFVQEIRDETNSSFNQLCSLLPDYNCYLSSRAGRTTSKEQYGIFYKKYIPLKNIIDYNPDQQDRWERPPIEATLDIGQGVKLISIHTKPTDVNKELSSLESIVQSNSRTIIFGDLNADCDYYPIRINFLNWKWIIPDYEDTTVYKSTSCAYDNFIINNETINNYITYGIDRSIEAEQSDHYLIYANFKF